MKKQLFLFLPIMIICSLSLFLAINAQGVPTVTVTASQTTLEQSEKAQVIEFTVTLSNKSPVARDIAGVDFTLVSDSPYLRLDTQALELTDAFAYETQSGGTPQADTLEGYLYQELSTSAVTYKDAKFTALKVKGTSPAAVPYTEFMLIRIKATLSPDAPAGEYTVTASDFTAADVKGDTVITDSFSCTVNVVEPAVSVGETFTTYYLTLQGKTIDGQGGDIGIHLKMQLSDQLLDDEDAYINVNYNNTDSQVPLTDLDYDSASDTYILTTPIKAAHMTKPVTVTVYNGKGEHGSSLTYSIKGYCDVILEHYADYYPQLVPMLHAMLNYGAAAQSYFDVDTDTLANSSLTAEDGWDKINNLTAMTGIEPTVFNGQFEDVGFTNHTISLILNAETMIEHYITLGSGENIENYEFKVDGKAVSPVDYGGRYRLVIDRIPASKLHNGYTLSVKRISDGKVYEVTYSALNYVEAAYEIYKDYPDYAKLCDLLKSIYLYNDAARTYFGK
ncbi:MAG: hypothetical protein IJE90_09430 [Clostridia bacterium]|nr:hypothetical protein [Clostridia bacterium]